MYVYLYILEYYQDQCNATSPTIVSVTSIMQCICFLHLKPLLEADHTLMLARDIKCIWNHICQVF